MISSERLSSTLQDLQGIQVCDVVDHGVIKMISPTTSPTVKFKKKRYKKGHRLLSVQ
ncbi:hypothetical protein KIN20_020590 [Parelaphostrongylus tenuis]|uniref:Uncharacterized protein n=1 Tax=Parelaphostrongylus tenuis TaxID=148309 RepID=A0AAD5MMN8_PARTN|nr:hypothetical protein KIN20_020590 [Parelaphostrongylus tenuis]